MAKTLLMKPCSERLQKKLPAATACKRVAGRFVTSLGGHSQAFGFLVFGLREVQKFRAYRVRGLGFRV